MLSIDMQCTWSLVGIHLIKVVFIVLKYCEMIWWLTRSTCSCTNFLSCSLSSLNVNYVESDANNHKDNLNVSYALISYFEDTIPQVYSFIGERTKRVRHPLLLPIEKNVVYIVRTSKLQCACSQFYVKAHFTYVKMTKRMHIK